jgi:hypothetical protein
MITDPLQHLYMVTREICWREVLLILDAKSCALPEAFNGVRADHWRAFRTKDKQVVLFDNPYIWSEALEREPELLNWGWRVLHLPLHMSWYTAGKCQPRLLVPPSSHADLTYLAQLLGAAGCIGNFVLTKDFINGGHECGGLAWQRLWAVEIQATLTSPLDLIIRNTRSRLKRRKS